MKREFHARFCERPEVQFLRPTHLLAPKGSDEPLDERMSARHERNALEFLDVENSQIRLPAMKPEQRVVIGAEAATAELACEAGVLRVGAKSFGFILTLKRDQP